MYKNNKILAIIPARGGSKGIKNKNIIDVCGKPLIGYTIDAAKKSKYIDYIYVSTDSDKIRDVALEYGASIPFMRDPSLASDTSKTIDAIVYSIDEFKKRDTIFDYLVLLQPTSPLRTAKDIDTAIEKLLSSNNTSLVSVSKVQENPILMRTINDDGTLNRIIDTASDVRRQDFKDYYRVNGAIYINKIDNISHVTSLNDNNLAYIMDQHRAIDIDTYEDLELVKSIISKGGKNDKSIKYIWN